MSRLVADASALVSLGTVAGNEPDPLSMCMADYDAVVPAAVIQDLQETASYEDPYGRAATAVLERSEALETRSVSLDSGSRWTTARTQRSRSPTTSTRHWCSATSSPSSG